MQNVTDVCNSDDDTGGGDRVSDLASSDKRAKRRKICGGGGGGGGARNSFADRLKAAMERGNTPGESLDTGLGKEWSLGCVNPASWLPLARGGRVHAT